MKKNLIDAWNACIDDDYCLRRINSEHGLQASFYKHLLAVLPKTRTVFVEPKIKGARVYPDIVICNTREVIGVIELKYQPRVKPSLCKDLQSLCDLANRQGLQFSNKRYAGPVTDGKIYKFSEHILFAWAGIHRYDADLENRVEELLSDYGNVRNHCFLRLHAIPNRNPKPEIRVI
ncbi:MAG TPA: hypothetical protein VF175_03055 [Lacipirellula sp.]